MAKMFEQEPGPIDENDPDVKEELFQTLKAVGATADDLVDPEEAAEYAEWLSKQ